MYLRFDDTLSISCLNNLCIVCDLPYNRKGKSGMKWCSYQYMYMYH